MKILEKEEDSNIQKYHYQIEMSSVQQKNKAHRKTESMDDSNKQTNRTVLKKDLMADLLHKDFKTISLKS